MLHFSTLSLQLYWRFFKQSLVSLIILSKEIFMEVFVLFILFLGCLFIKAVFFKPNDPTSRDEKKYKEGIELVNTRRYEEAFQYFNEALKVSPNSGLAFAYRGKCNLYLNDLFAAIYDSTEALAYDHCIADAYLVKGTALFELEMYKEAYLEFDKAVWYSRKNGEAYRWRALCSLKIGTTDRVHEDFAKAIELGDEHANYYAKKRGMIEKL
jgi:tetratricopeptide (TPR) repeat protein